MARLMCLGRVVGCGSLYFGGLGRGLGLANREWVGCLLLARFHVLWRVVPYGSLVEDGFGCEVWLAFFRWGGSCRAARLQGMGLVAGTGSLWGPGVGCLSMARFSCIGWVESYGSLLNYGFGFFAWLAKASWVGSRVVARLRGCG